MRAHPLYLFTLPSFTRPFFVSLFSFKSRRCWVSSPSISYHYDYITLSRSVTTPISRWLALGVNWWVPSLFLCLSHLRKHERNLALSLTLSLSTCKRFKQRNSRMERCRLSLRGPSRGGLSPIFLSSHPTETYNRYHFTLMVFLKGRWLPSLSLFILYLCLPFVVWEGKWTSVSHFSLVQLPQISLHYYISWIVTSTVIHVMWGDPHAPCGIKII